MACMAARSFLSAYLLVGLLNVISVAASNDQGVILTKPLLMPLLMAWLIAETRSAWPTPLRLLLAGLAFAWLGDLLLMGDTDMLFALGIAAFLVTQVAYAYGYTRVEGIAFRRGIPHRSDAPVRGIVSRRPVTLLPFALFYVALVLAIWPTADQFRLPVLVYGICLVAMAVSALNLIGRAPAKAAWTTFAGAALFVASDSLIALTSFGPVADSPAMGALIMLTYVIGQGLIAVGLVTVVRDLRQVRAALTSSTEAPSV